MQRKYYILQKDIGYAFLQNCIVFLYTCIFNYRTFKYYRLRNVGLCQVFLNTKSLLYNWQRCYIFCYYNFKRRIEYSKTFTSVCFVLISHYFMEFSYRKFNKVAYNRRCLCPGLDSARLMMMTMNEFTDPNRRDQIKLWGFNET